MKWLLIAIVVLAAAAALVWWRRSRQAPRDPEREVRDLQASAEARKRLDEQRNPRDFTPGSGAGGVGGAIG